MREPSRHGRGTYFVRLRGGCRMAVGLKTFRNNPGGLSTPGGFIPLGGPPSLPEETNDGNPNRQIRLCLPWQGGITGLPG